MRPAVLLLAAALPAAAGEAPRPAAPAPAVRAPRPLPGQPVELRSIDGWTLKAAWSPAREGRPTVVLLHGTGQRKEDWRRLAGPLVRAGIGVLAADLRGHGESRVNPAGETISYKDLRTTKEANDYEDMTRDVEAAVAFLAGQGVPEEGIGLAGAEVGGSVAVKYAAVHPAVPFVALLSPGLTWRDVPIVNAVRAFKGRSTPILLVHSEADKRSAKETPLLFAFAKNSVGAERAALWTVPQERGTRMLARDRGLAGRLVDWINDPAAAAAAVPASTAAPAAVQPPAADAGDDEE